MAFQLIDPDLKAHSPRLTKHRIIISSLDYIKILNILCGICVALLMIKITNLECPSSLFIIHYLYNFPLRVVTAFLENFSVDLRVWMHAHIFLCNQMHVCVVVKSECISIGHFQMTCVDQTEQQINYNKL